MNYTFLSYNVSFERKHIKERTQEIVKLIHEHKPDFICLQELTGYSKQFLQQQLHRHYIFAYVDEIITQKREFGEAILVKQNFQIQHVEHIPLHETKQSRQLHIVTVQNESGQIFDIINTQFETSPLYDKIRHLQLEKIDQMYSKIPRLAIVGCDTRFFSTDEYHSNLGHMIDIYELCQEALGGTHQWTLDYIHNTNLSEFADQYTRERPDRIFITKTQPYDLQCTIIDFKLIGNKPFTLEDKTVYPSDHYGLFLTFELKSRSKKQNSSISTATRIIQDNQVIEQTEETENLYDEETDYTEDHTEISAIDLEKEKREKINLNYK